ncbi:hypothetical protein Tco_0270523 [Tanacetum coccineum]
MVKALFLTELYSLKFADLDSQGERVEKLFRKCTLSGLRFMVGAVFTLAGVLKGTDILDASPLTHLYLGVLNVVGLLGFLLGGWLAAIRVHCASDVTSVCVVDDLSEVDCQHDGMARDGVTYTPMIGIALLAVFYMGDDMKHTSTPIWIAYYNFGAFWMYQGAMLLERGLLFETWVVGGMIMSLAMILSGLMSIFTPTPNHPIILIFNRMYRQSSSQS